MDGARGICRRYHWWLCLLCLAVFVSSADAATRRYPTMPSPQSVGMGGTAVGKTSTTYSIDQEGVDYIPSTGTTSKGTKLPTKTKYDYSIPRTFQHAKNGMRGGIVGIGASIAVGMMLDEIGAFIDENTKQPMKMGKELTPSTDLYWRHNTGNNYCDNSSVSKMKLATPTEYPILYEQWQLNSDLCSATYTLQNNGAQVLINYKFANTGQCSTGPQGSSSITYYRRGSCPSPYVYDSEFMQCAATNVPVELTEADYGLMEAFANAQNSAWLQGLLKDVCAGSPNPAGCFNELKEQGSSLSGPSSVPGPSSTTTSTYTDANGVSQQTTSTQNTTYQINYGSNYYDYRKVITTTKTGTDGSSETSTETETPEVTEEEKPPEEEQEEEQVAPSPCTGSSCDGPAYEDQYQPTEETKEDHIDSYVDRVSSIPIIQAVGNLFEVSSGGSCPVWTFNHQLEVGGFSTNINLVFDYLCLPWFTQYGPWIRAVIYMVAVYAAIRIALL